MILRSINKGIIATAALLAVYFAILGLLSGFPYAWGEFARFWYFIVALAVGFGIQVGLFFYLKDCIRQARSSRKVLAVSGTTSTTAMLSCCAHYVVNILPVLGVAGLVTLISQYQIHLFWVGLLFNAAGIAYISWKIISFRGTRVSGRRFARMKYGYFLGVVFVMLLFGISGVQLIVAGSGERDVNATEARPFTNLAQQTNREGSVTVRVQPEEITAERWTFAVSLDTHTVELTDDIAKSALVRDGEGNEYSPIRWVGDPPGGHHRSGVLEFEAIVPQPSSISLQLNGVGGGGTREFNWNLH